MLTLRKVVAKTTRTSLSQVAIRNVTPRLSYTALALRYQSTTPSIGDTVTATMTDTPKISTPPPIPEQNIPQTKQDEEIKQARGTSTSGSSNHRRTYDTREPINRKLKDITDQIQETMTLNKGFEESYNIFEEGISFIKSIQKQEGISDLHIFYQFYPLALHLYVQVEKKNKLNDQIIRSKSKSKSEDNQIEENKDGEKGSDQDHSKPLKYNTTKLFNLLVENKIAHPWHFLRHGVNRLRTDLKKSDDQMKSSDLQRIAYQNFIKDWLKYFEYTKNNPFVFVRTIRSIKGKDSKISFQPFHMNNLALFSYVQLCHLGLSEYSPEHALKFTTENQLPPIEHIERTLRVLGLLDRKSFNVFVDFLRLEDRKRLDPNGEKTLASIDNAFDRKRLDQIYRDIVVACKKRDIPVSQKVIYTLMSRYLIFEEYNEVFTLFENIIESGISPSIEPWNIVLKAMTNPTRIRTSFKTDSGKEQLLIQFERAIQTIVDSGLEFNAETIGAIISAYSNLGEFEKAEKCLEKYASIPGAENLGKNGLIRGLISNQKIGEAEKKLHEFLNDGKKYLPDTNVMNDFLNYYAKKKNYKAINSLTKFMQQHDIAENVATRTILINTYFESLHAVGKTPDLSAYLAQMESSDRANKKGFNEQMHSTLMKGLLQAGNILAGRQLYQILKKRYPRSPWITTQMIIGEINFGDVKIAEDLFLKYIKDIRDDVVVWNTFINNVLHKDEALAERYFNKMKNMKKANFYSYYFMLQHYKRKGDTKKMQGLLQSLQEVEWRDFGEVLPKLIKDLAKEIDVPSRLLEKLEKYHL